MKKIFLVLMLSVVCTNVFADETPVVVVPKPTEDINTGHITSAENRKNKSYFLAGQVAGVGPSESYDNLGSSLFGGLYIDPNSLVLLDYTKGYGPTLCLWCSESIKTNSVGLSYKHFTANTFYFRAGADYRTVDYSYLSSSNSSNQYKFKGESVTASFSIGNQWQWENFTLGCDWVGYSLPVYSRIYTESSTGSPTLSSISDDQDRYVKNGTFSFVRFYLGATF